MLLDGEIDVAMTAWSPQPYEQGVGTLRHMLPDWRQIESDYYAYGVEDNRKTLEIYLRYAYE